MVYEWDSRKAESNFHKHKVSFAEAASVFLDAMAYTYFDPDHSAEEDREMTIGMSSKQRVLFVSHCVRGDRIRIISARRTTHKEQLKYEQSIGKEG